MKIGDTVPQSVVPRIDPTCPYCRRATGVFRATGPLLPGGLRLEEFQVLVRNEWRRRLGLEAYGRAHSEEIPRTLALHAMDPADEALRTRLIEGIRSAAAEVLAARGGWGDVRWEVAQLAQAIQTVFLRVGVHASTVRKAYVAPLEKAAEETMGASAWRSP